MNLVPCDLRSIMNAPSFKGTKNYDIIMEFVESDYDCVKIQGWTHVSAFSCTASLNKSIARFNKGGIKAITHNGEVYLVKENKKKVM